MTQLHVIQGEVQLRCDAIVSRHGNWPCRRGCDNCCRRLASVPRVTAAEWQWIAMGLDALPAHTAEQARRRIRETAGASRPIVCPLLDTASGTCLVYEARPIACRTYGFYAEREYVLGCSRIEFITTQSSNVVWGNHAAVEDRMRVLGPVSELSVWLAK